MEKTHHAARGAGGGHRAGRQRAMRTLLPPPPLRRTAPQELVPGGPGPRVSLPAPDAAGGRPRSPPSPTACAQGPAHPATPSPHPESKLARRGDPRHGVGPQPGLGRAGRGHHPLRLDGRLPRSLVPGARSVRGRCPALPSSRRTSRAAAAEGALPAPARSRASFIARPPTPLLRDAALGRRTAPHSFQGLQRQQ